VKLGLYVDLRNPPGWRRPWVAHYSSTLDRIAAADRLGIDSVWLTEHHFFEDGYLPQPLTFAAAVAARTTRLRVGIGIVIAPLRHALHLAEEAAVVDLISGGRLELGFGAGWSSLEFEAFGVDIADRFTLTEATVVEVRRLLDRGIVTPPPVQCPIPYWLGYGSATGARRAGRLGVGLLSLDATLLDPYRAGLEEGGHGADAARMGGLLDVVVADDPELAHERILPYAAYQRSTYRREVVSRRDRSAASTADALRASGAGPRVVSPEDAVALIQRRCAGLPVEHVYVWASIAGMPDDLAERHLELVCGPVRDALGAAAGFPADRHT
jgi:alkanesulfonate monooxygenase SsuD/methylene tetrahydromethanopterin reductase-like flavin-dependent oxidoreductase (luciferase family)